MARFRRQVTRRELVRREMTVLRSVDVAAGVRRLTFGGEDLQTLTADGPDDHVKLFFPSDDGVAGRDFTPRSHRAGAAELDIDFVLHDDPGPASGFAATAVPGQQIALGGPRGSRSAPGDAGSLVLVADPTALPAAARWLEALPDLPATLIAQAEQSVAADYLGDLLTARVRLHCADTDAAVLAAVQQTPVAADTFVWGAGEAGTLVPIRRYWRHDLGLPRAQVVVSGYWRRGVAGHDHHSPVDASDPD